MVWGFWREEKEMEEEEGRQGGGQEEGCERRNWIKGW